MSDARVTLVISPRERFSFCERALASIYQNTTLPFRLIYVTGGAPRQAHQILQREAQQKGFELIHTPTYLSPNQSRNLAIPKIDTEFVVFLDNDALVAPGWLEHLLQCADETKAWIVGPLYMIGEFERATIHMAGGRLTRREVDGKQVLLDEQYLYDTPIAKANMRLRRRQCEYVEFHCMLIRTDMFEQVGLLDERLLNLHEERDICMLASAAGGGVYIEPKSVVSYVPPPPCEWWDLPYFMLRWSEDWSVASVRRFNQKWDVASVQHVSDETNGYEEGTVVGFASAWRSRVAGLAISEAEAAQLQPLEQAQLMTALLASVDREYFSWQIKSADGELMSDEASLPTPKVVMGLADLADDTLPYHITVSPLRRGTPKEPVLICVSDLTKSALEDIAELSFMVLQLASDCYQCWFALSPQSWAKLSDDSSTNRYDRGNTAALAGGLSSSSGESGPAKIQLLRGQVGNLLPDHRLADQQLARLLGQGAVY